MQTETTEDHGVQLDARGRKRSKATMPGYGKGRPPKSKGVTYPPHPFEARDIHLLMEACAPTPRRQLRWDEEMAAIRLRALIAVLWRSGLRISEGLALDDEQDLNARERTITVRHGKGDKRRVVAMDDWGWRELDVWLAQRRFLKPGAVFCVLQGDTEGRPVHDSDIRRALKAAADRAGLRRRCNPHAFRHTLAVELWREDVREHVIQAQLGHARLDVTARYLRGLDPGELLAPVSGRRAPVMPVPHLMQTLARPDGAQRARRRAERTLAPASSRLDGASAQSSEREA